MKSGESELPEFRQRSEVTLSGPGSDNFAREPIRAVTAHSESCDSPLLCWRRQKRPDPIWNGILIGALAGAAYPFWYFNKGYETGESLRENVGGVGAVVGVCVGAWIDRRVRGEKVICERPGRRAMLVTPAFSGRRVSVHVSFRIRD